MILTARDHRDLLDAAVRTERARLAVSLKWSPGRTLALLEREIESHGEMSVSLHLIRQAYRRSVAVYLAERTAAR